MIFRRGTVLHVKAFSLYTSIMKIVIQRKMEIPSRMPEENWKEGSLKFLLSDEE